MVAQLRTGYSPLLDACLHRIGDQDSATCPHCNVAEDSAEHLMLHCAARDQIRQGGAGRCGPTNTTKVTQVPVELS